MMSQFIYDAVRKLSKHKLLLVLLWGLILGLNTWTEDLGDLLRLRSIGFRWIAHPDYWSFFDLTDLTKVHHYFVIVKLGHFISFAIFDFLLFYWKQNHKTAFFLSFLLAITTEILQLFFGRDGRLYDVTIDTLGAISVYFIVKFNLLDKPKKMIAERFLSD